MSDKTLLQLIGKNSLAALKEHLSLYALDEIGQSIGENVVNDNGEVKIGDSFLNASATMICTLLQENGDFMLQLKAVPEEKPFAEFFPQMLPYNPWGVIDADEYPLPALQSVSVENISWQYVYFSTTDDATQKILWEKITGEDDSTLAVLKKRSGIETSLDDEPLQWVGGLFNAGTYKLPWSVFLPPEILWKDLIPSTTDVKGCVYQQGGMTFLKLMVPLLSKDNPFSDGVIKNISLAFEFSSAFADPEESTALLFPGGERRVGLAGTIQIGDNSEVTLQGSWPLDGDEILINANCSLDKIKNYFSGSSIGVLTLPQNVAASIVLSISKSERQVDEIAIGFELKNWDIVKDTLKLTDIDFDVRVFSAGSLNLTMANFVAKAAIKEQVQPEPAKQATEPKKEPAPASTVTSLEEAPKSIDSVNLICTGTYPDGIYYLGLDPATPVHLNALIKSITGIDTGMGTNLSLSELSGSYNAGAQMYSLLATVSSNAEWNAGPQLSTQTSGIHLENISATLRGAPNNLFCSLKADFSISYTNSEGLKDRMHFDVQCIYSGSWFFSADYTGDISLADVGNAMGINNIPAFLNNCTLNGINLSYNSADSSLSITAKSTITIEEKPVEIDLSIYRATDTFEFSGQFIYNGQSFDLTVSRGEHKSNISLTLVLNIAGVAIQLVASSRSEDKEGGISVSDKKFNGEVHNLSLSIMDSIRSLTGTHFDKPDWLPDIKITDIKCTHDGGSGITTLTATAKVDDHPVQFVFYKEKSEKEDPKTKKPVKTDRYAFGLSAGDVSLGGLPVVGDVLKEVAINNLGFVYASEEANYSLSFASDTDLNNSDVNDKNTSGKEGTKYKKGFNFLGKLKLPHISTIDLSLSAKEQDSESPPIESNAPVTPAPTIPNTNTPLPNTFQSNSTWFDVNKKLGPVSVDKVGFQANGGTLELLVIANIAVGPLTFILNGLGISFEVAKLFKKEFNPSFRLEGLGLVFNSPPVEIGGSFIKTQIGNPPSAEYEYNGTAIIKATDFTLSALGSYTNVNGNVSLFVYGYLEKSLGGPSFFFVEGLALGFGYNRAIVMPAVEEVAHFPLVAQVMGGAGSAGNSIELLQQELTSLDSYLPVETGELFLAVGVKFNSFKLIDSFALLAVSFGNHTEINVLGQSDVAVPISKDGKKPENPLAEIKILLVAKYLPDEGFLGVTAQLSNDSYIFSKDCHLTGGAAFYSWFKGEHEGDFVVTMGGYHPHFNVPAHYPQVPRLALNWQISSNMSIKGDMYFALCPHAFMAGGHLEALYSRGAFKAWFKAGADFLITWQPYHYEASIYLDIGASLHVDLWFTSFTITIEIGADVEIWGPDFSGKATVHIYCFDITIGFGTSDSSELKAIDWVTFKNSSLPAPEKTLAISITNGQHGKDEDGTPIINPKELEVVAETLIPVKKFDETFTSQFKDKPDSNMLQGFGVAPMAKDNTSIGSIFTVSVSYKENKDETSPRDISSNIKNYFDLSAHTKKMPAAIWGKELKQDLNEEQKLIDVVNGFSFVAKEPVQVGAIHFPRLQEIVARDTPPILVNWQQIVPVSQNAESNLRSKLGLKQSA